MSKECRGFVKAWEATVRKSQAKAKKRANSLFSTMSVAPADDEPGDVYHAEKVFSNGDFYTGQWADSLPHGHGKYLWTDGCMYVGEWHRGKTMGKGKFSWPSGATYEGEFKSGYMDGKGTYTGSSNATYRGSWVRNLKHGQGTKSFANGDYYEGEWRRGLQDGHGRYNWKNGNHYIGQWKNGMFFGNGTMIWSNGNRYDGCWEENYPKGNGTFRWADGSFYVGIWSLDPKEQSGTYYPSGSPESSQEWDPQEVFTVELKDCQVCPCEQIFIFPSQKVLSASDGEFLQKQAIYRKGRDVNVRHRRKSCDVRISNCSRESIGDNPYDGVGKRSGGGGIEGLGNLDLDYSVRGNQPFRIPPVKKQGMTISKGHKNYDLMLNLQLGIRY